MTPSRLAFDDVACLRGGRLLFEGLSFTLEEGGAALVTGPNGAGKSSLIRVAAGLLKASAGTVSVEGERALLTEAAALDPELPVARALVEKTPAVLRDLPDGGRDWSVHYALFARAGATANARQELTRRGGIVVDAAELGQALN